MRMRALTSLRILGSTVLAGLMLAGCSTSKARRSQADADVRLTSFWRPSSLYLGAAPYARLYVEVDAVEGCVPSDASLNKLHEFLAMHCDKPGGIEIVRSDVIPARAARGIAATTLAQRYLNGPPDTKAASLPAFLYVLFYDGASKEEPTAARTGHPGMSEALRPRAPDQNPHVDLLPYPAMVYLNATFGPKSARDLMLLHEAGHVLGLAGRTTFASGYHCLDRTCLMNKALRWHLGRYLLGRNPIDQTHLCERCRNQLAASRRLPPPANLRFVGPVLVRSETGYHVLSLAHRVKLIFGQLSDQDCREYAAAVRADKPVPGVDEGARHIEVTIKDEVRAEPTRLREIMERAQADPYEVVRVVTPRFHAQARAEWYRAHGQFTELVKVWQEVIRADPASDWGYNSLAWLMATCPEAAMRDGKGAVAAARKACELTRWQEWSWIDTLAAAYAEAGDFKRAVLFQQRAMRTGHPAESDQREMQARILLFQQSRPFRENP